MQTELLAKLDEAKQFDAEAFIKEALQKIRHKHEHTETPEQRKERYTLEYIIMINASLLVMVSAKYH